MLLDFLNYIHSLPGDRDPGFVGKSYLNLPIRESSLPTRNGTKEEVMRLDATLAFLNKEYFKQRSVDKHDSKK